VLAHVSPVKDPKSKIHSPNGPNASRRGPPEQSVGHKQGAVSLIGVIRPTQNNAVAHPVRK
jgi:hypothetical protein